MGFSPGGSAVCGSFVDTTGGRGFPLPLIPRQLVRTLTEEEVNDRTERSDVATARDFLGIRQ